MRAFVYLRQSMDREGTGAAVTRQREDCLRLCAARGWDNPRVWPPETASASSRKPRPVYSQMLKAIEAGEADVLVAWHVDRLTRKITDLEHLIELAERTGLLIVTVTGDLDLSNDSGRLVGRILASVARGEVERKSARQKRAQLQAAQQGRPAGGRRPFGYASNGVDIIETEASLIRTTYADVLAGASLKSIARRWNEAGSTTTASNPWRHDNVRGVLLNPRYAGLRTYRGEVVGPAVWEPLVDQDTHAAVVAILRQPERRTTTSVARKYLLPGLARCGRCGSDAATGHSRHGKRLYICRAKKCISRKADPVDHLVESVIVARLSQQDVASLIAQPDVARQDELRRQADLLEVKIAGLAEGYEKGIFDLNSAEQAGARLRAQLASIREEMTAGVEFDALRPLVRVDDVASTWRGMELAQKRAVIDALMEVTLLKPERGHQPFDPRSVKIEWKVG